MSDNTFTDELNLCQKLYPGFKQSEPILLDLQHVLDSYKPVGSSKDYGDDLLRFIKKAASIIEQKQPTLSPAVSSLLDLVSNKLSSVTDHRGALEAYKALCVEVVERDLLTLLFTSAMTTLQQGRGAKDEVTPEAWDKGYCPVCHTKPHYGLHCGEDGKKHLECWLCTTRWPYPRLKCPFCDNTDSNSLGYFTINTSDTCRVYYCSRCGQYHKVFDFRQSESVGSILALHNLASLPCDTVAARDGLKPGSGLHWNNERELSTSPNRRL